MRYATPVRAALDQRLKNQVAQTGIPLVLLRKTIAFDQFGPAPVWWTRVD